MARILVCDDSMFMRMILKKALVENGHEVVDEAGDGSQAVQLHRQHKPDLTTMDITMPVMDGIEAVKIIRDEDPTARIIMVTAIGQKAIITDAIKAGASGFIVKPFDHSQIKEVVKRVLAD
ncbi:two-component system response regulator [Anaerosporomusa subterranea]|uniref:Two-component system response regulator n=1 Tax=Anaerosporomusa subterranea TaxID=1794912 RepID=A0A154BTK7_ANASB|nr:response regulator [Anaerosporomusa subterranea]KYZ77354.1 two-component system response regulator [Anaerosporomusa subterranea]